MRDESDTPDLSVIILTFNEEIHLERALKSVASITRQVFVIDSYSTDNTIDIARAHGAIALQNKFVSHSRQFNWALENAPIRTKWVMRVDADEVLEDDLVLEIREKMPSVSADVAGVILKRKHIFMGRWIRHGGRYPLFLLRIWRHGQGRVEDRWMDEHIFVSGGHTINFDGSFSDHNLHDLTFFIDKHNKYATREAIEILNRRHGLFASDRPIVPGNTSLQASAKRSLKEHFYNKLPFQFSALLYFVFRYVAQLGFLDGREGLIYHFLQGFWYRFLVGAKVHELERAILPLGSPEARRREVARLTGLQLEP